MNEQASSKEQAIQRMARAICNAWASSPGCLADESGKSPCTAKNCSIYTVAVHALQELGELPASAHEPQPSASKDLSMLAEIRRRATGYNVKRWSNWVAHDRQWLLGYIDRLQQSSHEPEPDESDADTCRLAFQAWANDIGLCLDEIFMSSAGVPEHPYEDNDTNQFWRAWLASWKAKRAAQPPPAAPLAATRLLGNIDEYLSRSPGEAIHAGSIFHQQIKGELQRLRITKAGE